MRLNDYSNPNYIGSKFRKKRFQFFEEKLGLLKKPVSIIDMGGTVQFWENENYQQKDVRITIINLNTEESRYSNIKVITGNACDLSLYENSSFDIAFSNSLIEHLHTKENQIRMAREAMRVGKYFFVQTPNRYFPIEPHFKFPFFQFLSKSVQVFLQTQTHLINGYRYDREYAENMVEEIKLLSKNEILGLFPKSKLYVERFLGLAKSFVVCNMPE